MQASSGASGWERGDLDEVSICGLAMWRTPSMVRPLLGSVRSAVGIFHLSRTTQPAASDSKNKLRQPGPRGSGEPGEDHHSQQFYLAGR